MRSSSQAGRSCRLPVCAKANSRPSCSCRLPCVRRQAKRLKAKRECRAETSSSTEERFVELRTEATVNRWPLFASGPHPIGELVKNQHHGRVGVGWSDVDELVRAVAAEAKGFA